MNDIIREARAERAYKKSVQEMMDEKMCRPGYRWHGEPLNRCLPAAAIDYRRPDTPDLPDTPTPPPTPPTPPPDPQPPAPEEAIAAEMAKRKKK